MTRYVQVPVPEEHVPRVFALLAQLQDGGPLKSIEEPSKLTAELAERIYRDSGAGLRALMEQLASRPDEWVESHELIEALSLPNGSKSLAGLVGGFGRRANHRYGGTKPWDYEWDRNRGEGRYRMRGEVAGWICDAAAEAD